MNDHRKLKAFELADDLVMKIYRATQKFPSEEMYGLKSQIRRGVVSIASNIVEGCARSASRAEYVRFLTIAYSSARELAYQLTIAVRLDYFGELEGPSLEEAADETARVLAGLLYSLKS